MANANALNAGADGVLRQGAAQESDVRYQSRKAIGAQAAAQWSNGFMGGTGSALDSVYESQVSAALDALRIRQGAQDQANSMNFQARLAREGAWFGLAGGLIGAAKAGRSRPPIGECAKAIWAAGAGLVDPRQYGGSVDPMLKY
jgi:hypothetical protein